MLMDELLDKITARLEFIEQRHGYLSFLINNRFANEKLLQLEAMRIISLREDVIEYLPEKPYDSNGREKCDFWFKTADSTECWMEIKTRPTNYKITNSYANHSKGIKNSVDSVIEDIQRLNEKVPQGNKKYALFAFYPLYPESCAVFNEKHLRRISQSAGKEIKSPNKSIKISDASFDLYLVEL